MFCSQSQCTESYTHHNFMSLIKRPKLKCKELKKSRSTLMWYWIRHAITIMPLCKQPPIQHTQKKPMPMVDKFIL